MKVGTASVYAVLMVTFHMSEREVFILHEFDCLYELHTGMWLGWRCFVIHLNGRHGSPDEFSHANKGFIQLFDMQFTEAVNITRIGKGLGV